MLRYWKLASALLVLSLGLAACPGPEEGGTPSLILTTNPRKVDANGQSATISVTAMDGQGQPGTGTVTLKAKAGRFEGDAAELTLPLADGKASATYSCDIAVDSRCSGFVLIDGLWNETPGSTSIQVGSSTGGNTDGGTDGGTGGNDGGTDGGTGGTGNTRISVTSSRNPIFFNVGDYSLITATLTRNDAGWADQQIEFSTTLGGLTAEGGWALTQTVTVNTDGEGKAVARFQETGSAGTASIEAKHVDSGAAASASVNVTTVQQIIYKSTLCNGAACTIMGVRGSGFNEQAQITFRLVDSQNKPASGVPVPVSIPNGPSGTTVSPSGVSNAQGEVTATVAAGRLIGAFVVHAVAIPGEVEVDSPTIGIRGAKSANNGFALQCNLVNIAA
ncbi:MAG TPA: hypothetical protein VLQ93_23710, partial [Myxococcaceae bacterium]|nr:hypothetical protein [Myxococcaceae bacterium]